MTIYVFGKEVTLHVLGWFLIPYRTALLLLSRGSSSQGLHKIFARTMFASLSVVFGVSDSSKVSKVMWQLPGASVHQRRGNMPKEAKEFIVPLFHVWLADPN